MQEARSNFSKLPEPSKELQAFYWASAFAQIPPCAKLLQAGQYHDEAWSKDLLRYTWNVFDAPVIVELDYYSQELLFYYDGRDRPTQFNNMIGADQAMKITAAFLQCDELKHISALPKDANFLGAKQREGDWELEWSHEINGVEVEGDFLRVCIDSQSMSVSGFTKKWSTCKLSTTIPRIAGEEAVQIAEEYWKSSFDLAEVNILTRLAFLKADLSDPSKSELVWRVTVEYRGMWLGDLWVSAVTGELLKEETAMFDGEVVAHDTQTGDDIWWQIRDGVKGRFESNRYSTDTRTNPSKSIDLAQWDDGDVMYHGSHGDWSQDHNWLLLYSGETIAYTDITMSLSNLRFLYVAACLSGGQNGIGGPMTNHPLHTTILNRGCSAYLGWNILIGGDDLREFTLWFFDYAENSYTINQCAQIADNLLPPGSPERNAWVIYGNAGVRLEEYDPPSDSWPGKYLGNAPDGQDRIFTWNYEPLWGPDVDWFYFTSTGFHYMSVWVFPRESDHDVILQVLDEFGHLVGYSNYGGGGYPESVSFEGYGSYFAQVWSNGHGGTYDLTVFLGIS
jgi:hypothetical protein